MARRLDDEIDALLDEAETCGSCAATTDRRLAEALRRREAAGELVSPIRGLWARGATWDSLEPDQRMLRQLRGLHKLHGSWVFAGTSAGVAHGLSVNWHLLNEVVILRERSGMRYLDGAVRSIRASSEEAVWAGGVPATTLARTALDCARELPLRDSLPIVDSALARHEFDKGDLELYVDTRVSRLSGAREARLAVGLGTDKSGSGGESIARAAIWELGFAEPELQTVVRDPVDGNTYYVDFCWRLPDGEVVYGELDGGEKYLDPRMTHGRGAIWKMRRERIRESRLTAAGAKVMRFSLEDVADNARFAAMLEGFGVPRVREPVVDASTTRPEMNEPAFDEVPIEAYGLD